MTVDRAALDVSDAVDSVVDSAQVGLSQAVSTAGGCPRPHSGSWASARSIPVSTSLRPSTPVSEEAWTDISKRLPQV